MSVRASGALVRHELRILATDPSVVIFVLVMPLLMTAFMQRLFRGALLEQGFAGANGSEFAVPGVAVAFATFGVGFSGFAFFREHGWGTWERLRASPATSTDIMIGKLTPAVAITVAQIGALFLLGGPLFDFAFHGSALGVTVLIVVLSRCLNAFGVMITALARTAQQLNAIGSAGGMVMATIGGAFVPVEVMPSWAQALAPAMPTYWAMRGFRAFTLEAAGFGAAVLPTVVMLAFTLAFTVVAAARFRFDESKVYFG